MYDSNSRYATHYVFIHDSNSRYAYYYVFMYDSNSRHAYYRVFGPIPMTLPCPSREKLCAKCNFKWMPLTICTFYWAAAPACTSDRYLQQKWASGPKQLADCIVRAAMVPCAPSLLLVTLASLMFLRVCIVLLRLLLAAHLRAIDVKKTPTAFCISTPYFLRFGKVSNHYTFTSCQWCR